MIQKFKTTITTIIDNNNNNEFLLLYGMVFVLIKINNNL